MSNLLQRLRCGECGEPEPDVTRCLRCVAADEIERGYSEVSRLEMALRHIHSLPIAESDTVKGFAGAVRAHCYQALEPVSEELPQCEHHWVLNGIGMTHCDKCGVASDPASEERTSDTCPECHGTGKTVIRKEIGVEDCPECGRDSEERDQMTEEYIEAETEHMKNREST